MTHNNSRPATVCSYTICAHNAVRGKGKHLTGFELHKINLLIKAVLVKFIIIFTAPFCLCYSYR